MIDICIFQNFAFSFTDIPEFSRLRSFQSSSNVHAIYMLGSYVLIGGTGKEFSSTTGARYWTIGS